jgi:hypothetical protein
VRMVRGLLHKPGMLMIGSQQLCVLITYWLKISLVLPPSKHRRRDRWAFHGCKLINGSPVVLVAISETFDSKANPTKIDLAVLCFPPKRQQEIEMTGARRFKR